MEGAARVFSGEFCRATLSRSFPGQDSPLYVVTPTGVWCNSIFSVGVLTEVSCSGARISCRVADPTGAFGCTVAADIRPDLADLLRKLPVPSFLAVTGSARLEGSSGFPAPVIRVESVRIVDRAVRDTWVARTAGCTLSRIGELAAILGGAAAGDPRSGIVLAHYRTTPAGLQEYLSMVESAVAMLPAASGTGSSPLQQDARGIVTGIIRDLQGSRGVPVDEVIAQAGIRGIGQDTARTVIDDLIREDECYQPQKGSVRLL